MKITKQQIARCFLFAIVCWCILTVTALADSPELVPYDPGAVASAPAADTTVAPSNSNEPVDYAGQLFTDTQFQQTPEVEGIVSTIANAASWLVTLVIGAIAPIMTIQLVIDMVCILLRPAAELCAHLPIQIVSDLCISITGIQFVGSGGNGGSGTSIEKADLKKENPFIFYIRNRLVTIVLAVIIFILLGSGLLFKIVFFLANTVVGWIAGLF